jgi:hypothetical protein
LWYSIAHSVGSLDNISLASTVLLAKHHKNQAINLPLDPRTPSQPHTLSTPSHHSSHHTASKPKIQLHQPTNQPPCMYACAASHKREWQGTPWSGFIFHSSFMRTYIQYISKALQLYSASTAQPTTHDRSQLESLACMITDTLWY